MLTGCEVGHDDGDVVIPAVVQCPLHQCVARRLRARGSVQQLGHLGRRNFVGQSVAAEQQAIAVVQGHVIDGGHGHIALAPQRIGQDVPHAHRLFGRHSRVDQDLSQRLVAGDLAQTLLAAEVPRESPICTTSAFQPTT